MNHPNSMRHFISRACLKTWESASARRHSVRHSFLFNPMGSRIFHGDFPPVLHDSWKPASMALKSRLLRRAWALCLPVFLFVGGWTFAQQPIYYNSSSAALALNTLDSIATNGANRSILLGASGPILNGVSRCTAMAVDGLNGKLFFVDDLANALWSVNLDGTGLAQVEAGLPGFPTDIALDVLNRKIYYATSSTIQNNNTVHCVNYTGTGDSTIFVAGGPSGNGASRCTAIAVDPSAARIFLADAGAQKIWSMSLAGTGLTQLAVSTPSSFPSDVDVDPVQEQVYFSCSSTLQGENVVKRVSYSGTNQVTLFTASSNVQRCTALALDVADSSIFLSDAGPGAPAIWRIPLDGGNASLVSAGLPATAKKVRWFPGPSTRPPPGLDGIQLSGSNVILNATNGFIGGTYFVLTSTNLSTPLSGWAPLFTNVLGVSGGFSLTLSNSFMAHDPSRFYLLKVQ